MAVLLSGMVDDNNCSRGLVGSPDNILGITNDPGPKLCHACGVVISAERLDAVPHATKCADCQADDDQEEFYVMESMATGSEGKTSRVAVRMPRELYKRLKRPGYGSNLKFDRS